MLSLNEVKTGAIIEYNLKPHKVLWVEHSKKGRAGAVLRTRLFDLVTSATIEHTFKGNEKISEIALEKRKFQYLYNEGDNYFFMNPADFSQITITKINLSGKENFLVEGADAEIVFYDDKPISISLPIKMKFKVTYTEPGFRGNTQSTVTKPAKIETGAEIKVPLFINTDDEVIIDTRNGNYVERA